MKDAVQGRRPRNAGTARAASAGSMAGGGAAVIRPSPLRILPARRIASRMRG
jgi:hypothetical protein